LFRFMKTKVAAALLVVAAISVPAANAQPIGFVPPAARDTSAASGSAGAATVRTVEVSSNGFDWGDAAIGAGAILMLAGVGGGALVIARRRGEPMPTS